MSITNFLKKHDYIFYIIGVILFLLAYHYTFGCSIHLCACIHNLDEAICSTCLSMKDHLVVIAQCPHNHYIKPLNFDAKLIGQICDFGSIHQTHPVATTINDVVYYCKRCHAISCSSCYTG